MLPAPDGPQHTRSRCDQVTNLLGGFAAQRWGAKGVLASGVALWSAFTMATPLAAETALPALLASRVAMGVGEGALRLRGRVVGVTSCSSGLDQQT